MYECAPMLFPLARVPAPSWVGTVAPRRGIALGFRDFIGFSGRALLLRAKETPSIRECAKGPGRTRGRQSYDQAGRTRRQHRCPADSTAL
jgi:hypothetical protein